MREGRGVMPNSINTRKETDMPGAVAVPEMPRELWHTIKREVGSVAVDGSYFYHACNAIADAIRAHLPGQARKDMLVSPPIVCLCGSTRFYEAFQEANYRYTMEGNIVLSVGFYPHAQDKAHGEDRGCTPEQKIKLDELHKRKIDLCDFVAVLDVNGYIGDSTRSEIEYAEKLGRPVHYIGNRHTSDHLADASKMMPDPDAERVGALLYRTEDYTHKGGSVIRVCNCCHADNGEHSLGCLVPAIEMELTARAEELESSKWNLDQSRANQHLLGNAVSALIHKYGPILIPDEQLANERSGTLDAKEVDGGILVDFIETDSKSECGSINHAAYDVMEGMLRELRAELTARAEECEGLKQAVRELAKLKSERWQLKGQAEAWETVFRKCYELGMPVGNNGTGIDMVIDFISRTAEECERLKQAWRDVERAVRNGITLADIDPSGIARAASEMNTRLFSEIATCKKLEKTIAALERELQEAKANAKEYKRQAELYHWDMMNVRRQRDDLQKSLDDESLSHIHTGYDLDDMCKRAEAAEAERDALRAENHALRGINRE